MRRHWAHRNDSSPGMRCPRHAGQVSAIGIDSKLRLTDVMSRVQRASVWAIAVIGVTAPYALDRRLNVQFEK
jgi:hypothetical protein